MICAFSHFCNQSLNPKLKQHLQHTNNIINLLYTTMPSLPMGLCSGHRALAFATSSTTHFHLARSSLTIPPHNILRAPNTSLRSQYSTSQAPKLEALTHFRQQLLPTLSPSFSKLNASKYLPARHTSKSFPIAKFARCLSSSAVSAEELAQYQAKIAALSAENARLLARNSALEKLVEKEEDIDGVDGPLSGLRVVEVGNFIAGPFAGTLLGGCDDEVDC